MKQIIMCLASVLALDAVAACSTEARGISPSMLNSRQQAAIAAAYALRTPERTVRFANDWAFAKAIYEGFEKFEKFERFEGFEKGSAWSERFGGGLDAAIQKVAAMLQPGDLVVSDGTNVCFYAGDVYGDGRGKVLALDPVGGVCEWDVGTYLFNWPHNQKKLAVAKTFAVLRPPQRAGKCLSTRAGERPRMPQGIGEKIADERVRAVVATAWAHYLKNECTQYDSIGLISNDIGRDIYEKWSRREYRTPIEVCTRDRTYYSVCSSFAYEVYYNAFGYGIGDDHKGHASFVLTQYPPPDILVYRHEKDVGGKTDEEVCREARAALRPGDVIAYANVKKKKSGHVMLYIGEVDGIGTILHSTGQKFDFEQRFDKIEYEGTIIKNDVDSTLFTKGSPRYLLKYDQFVILRPLKKDSLALTAAGKARATHPKFRYDRRVVGGLYGSVVAGEPLRYSVEVFNAAKEPCDATVRETLPEGTELLSCSDGATTDGTTPLPSAMDSARTLVWPTLLQPGERRTVEWTVRVKMGTAGSFIVAEGGSAGGIPSNRLTTQVVARKISVEDAFRWAERSLLDAEHLPACRVKGWCGGYRTANPPRDERVRETRARDLMPGDVVATWTRGQSRPSCIWVKDECGLVARTPQGLEHVPEEKVSALLAADIFCAFRPAAE